MNTKHFKFESHGKALLPFDQFLKRVIKFALYALILIVFSVGIGTIGYKLLCHLSWIDGFYNACMILTGMGPVAVLTDNAGKLFASFYALFSGIAFLTTIAVLFAPVVHRFLHALHISDDL